MAINKNTLDGIIAGLGAMPKKSEIDTPTNNIDLLATETSEGLMSAEDKVKLNHVETGANNYVLPSAGKDSLGGVKTTSDVNSTKGYTPTPIIDGVPYYKDTLYTLPIATSNTLGGVKIGKNISISEDGAISVSDVSADQMTGIVPINKGGTGASNIHQARVNLKTSCFVIVGNTTENDEINSGYYQAFSVPTIASVQYTLRLLISPVTPSYDFEEFTVDIKLNTSASAKLTPVGYMSTVEEQYDVINKLYVAYNASITTGGFYFWYKNTSAKSVIRISVLSCTYSNDITQDGLQTISLNTSGACTSQDTISTSTPNVVLFSDIITTKLATSSMAGYMSKEDKAKLDALDSTLTEQASQLTSLVNNAYNTIGSPSTTTTTSTDSSDIPYNETKTTVKYEFSKPNGGKSTVSSTDTVIKYKNASSSNAGLLSSTDYDYIHSLPDVLSALEETVTNDITTTLDAHVTDTNNPHSVTKAQIGLGNVENKTSATIRNEITKANVTTALGYTPVTPTEFTTHIDEFDAHVANVSNPHSVTKTQIGLSNVENKSSEDIRGEITSTNVIDALTYTPAKATDLTSHISNKLNPHSVTKAQIGLGNVENKTSEDIRGELTATNVTTALGYTPVTPTDLSDHTSDTNNPHGVTKAQVGLGNVENKSSATIRGEITKANITTALGYTPVTPTEFTTHIDEFDDHVANVSNPHSVTKTQIGLGNVENKTSEDIRGEITSTNVTDALTYTPAKATDLTSHISNKSNPHSVTKAQIGLDNVENKTSEDIRGELTATNVTTALGYTPVTPTDLSDHTSDTNNPHSVTKAQIGLGNVENKSSATIRGELTKANVTTALGYTPPSSVTFTQSLTSGTKVGTLNVSGTDVDLYAPTNTDTHWATKLVVGASDTASANAAASNGSVYLNIFDNSTLRNAHKISGTNGVSVTSDSSGNITITGTTYSSIKNPYALEMQFNGTTQVSYDGSSAKTLNITPASIGASADNHTHEYLPLSGGTLTGQLIVLGLEASKPIVVRGIAGSDGNGNVGDLYLQHSANSKIFLGNTGGYTISADGSQYSGNSASATKLTTSAGSATQPVYFSGGKPVVTTYTLEKSVPSDAVFTDTVYSHPEYTEQTSGLYKITVDELGHVSAVSSVVKADITALGIPASDTNTHYTSKNVVGSSTDTANTTTALTNGNVYINSVENGAVTSAHKISGSGMSTVTTDTSGNIIVTATHPTSAGNKHIPSGGANGDTLMYSASGTAVWHNDYVVGTQTSSTNAFTGTLSGVSALYDGLSIRYYLPYAGTTSAATLKLTLSASGTTTAAIPIYRNNGSTFTNQCGAGSILYLTYRTATNRWTMSAQYDYDTFDRTKYSQAIKCDTTAITAGNIIVGNGGAFKHLKAGTAFDVTYPILYAASDISASATGTNNYIIIPFAVTTTQSITLTTYKPVFIKGSLSGTTFTPISTAPLTQTVPTSADGYEYILLGVAYNTTDMYLLPDHPIFAFKGGAFGQISSKGITDLSVSGQTVTYTRGDGTTGTITTQDTKVTNTLATTTKAYITGTTSATTNTGTLVFDTGVYLDTTAGRLYAKEFSEGGSLLSGKYRAHLACTVGQSSPVSDPWFKVGDIIFANYAYKNYDHMTTFRVFKPYADNARAVGILTTHIRTTPEGTFSSGELIWEYAGEGINIDNFKMACQPNSTTFTVELWVKIPYEWQYYHFDYIAAGNRTSIFNGVGWNLKSHGADGVASITEGYTIINSTLLKLKNPIADNQYLPTTGGLMTGNIGFHGSRCDREIIKFIDNTSDSTGQGIAIGGGGLTIIGGGESADAARDMYAGGDREDMLICNDYVIDFYSNCQSGMKSSKHYTMASGVITSESFNATSSYKINNKVAIQYNSTEECVNFVFS